MFAELNLKVASAYMMQYFDLKMMDSKFDRNNFPLVMIGLSKYYPIEVELTLNDDSASNLQSR